MKYIKWDEKSINDFTEKNISSLYELGYVFIRTARGNMQQTRSVRINLNKFKPSSENKRILKKVSEITMQEVELPYSDYDWNIGKLAQDFYKTKFGPGIFSANKIKEIMTDVEKSNFNALLIFSEKYKPVGYSIIYLNSKILHYSYPFYDIDKAPKDMGLGMMNKAIQYAKEMCLDYIYLGSLQRPNDSYKLQFEGLEWFDGKTWSDDLDKVREILKSQ